MRRFKSPSINIRGVFFCVAVVCVFGSAAFGQPWAGSGTAEDPYLIYDANQMNAIGGRPADCDKHFKLMANIDLSSFTGADFNTIGIMYSRDIYGVAVDPNGGKMYWTDISTDTIKRANLEGSGVESLFTTSGPPPSSSPLGIALDLAGGKMYWTEDETDIESGKIRRANLDGSGAEELITTGLINPRGIALDVSGGKMYWTDSDTNKIQRASLDGSGAEELITTGLIYPRGIALDVSGGKMYWTDPGTDKIQRANLDGNEVEDLITTGLSNPECIALDLVAEKMYWTDSGADKIQRANLDGNEVEDLITTGLSNPGGISLDLTTEKMYWADSGTDKLQRSDLDGSNPEVLIANYFRGVFDGNGQSIYNFTYSPNGMTYVGLFAYIDDPNAEVKDLELFDPNVDGGIGEYVGSLVGYLNRGSVTGCSVRGGRVSGTGWDVGSLVGESRGDISDCYSSSSVYGTCKRPSSIHVGGLVGENSGNISNCYSTGDTLGKHEYHYGISIGVGGLVGRNWGPISYCYSSSNVIATRNDPELGMEIGGLVGANDGDISNCYSTGNISGDETVGGLAGKNRSTISNSYSVGKVSGVSNVGGLIGENYDSVVNSFWDVNSSGRTWSDGGVGKTTGEMQTESTFTSAGWDFVGEGVNGPNDIWDICEGTNYPKFVWQIPVADFLCPDGVNFIDYAFFAEHWLETPCDAGNDWCGGADLDQLGDVDGTDLGLFVDEWLNYCLYNWPLK
jgi:DNA-binding beta-propeller fold protein YncE